MDEPYILVPGPAPEIAEWRITAPWLKLSLKYGLIGPWNENNPSVAFDRYSLTRGPKTGLPTIGDFAVTMLMNSNVKAANLARASEWLAKESNVVELARVRELLAQSDGLHDLTPATIHTVGSLLDRVEELPDIKTAKVAKWFAAWAPAHIPMIDQWVHEALVGRVHGHVWPTWAELLERYQRILRDHLDLLRQFGERLSDESRLSIPVPPVRALDSLLWFDWWGCEQYQSDFREWVTAEEENGSYHLTKLGRDYATNSSVSRVGK